MESDCLGWYPVFFLNWLCDFWWVTKPLCFCFLLDEMKTIIIIPTREVCGEDVNSLENIKWL